ncbi:MAG: hypothetical protein NTY72_14550 [Bacteroidetes bacterium]|nr:hypothetical protein [Bacteroidota bacterium]
MKLIVNHFPYKSFNDFDLHEFEIAILSDPIVKQAKRPKAVILKINQKLSKLLSIFNINHIKSTSISLLSYPLLDSKHLFSLMLGPDFNSYIPYSYFSSNNRSIYIFDAWPCHHNSIVSFVLNYKIDHLFVNSLQVTETLRKFLPSTNIHWIPEGIDPNDYEISKVKSIDVLSFGKKFNLYHETILPILLKNNFTYLYEKVKGEVVFKERSEFITGLGNAKISICFPSNITHPERSADIEVMTMRYLQSIVSKCLIVGQAPKEMIELFGYNPVIEIDWTSPENQITNILNQFNEYQYLIEKNFSMVVNNHTWNHRWSLIKKNLLQKQNIL